MTHNTYERGCLQSLTDDQLTHLHWRIIDRINRAFVGGTAYGIDRPTLGMVVPGLYEAYMAVQNEGKRRRTNG